MASQTHEPSQSPASATPTDGDLVLQTLAGRRQAFDELIRRYQRQAVAVSYRLLGNTQDALEVTQDAFLKGFKSLDTLERPEAFGGWLMRIVSNLSLNYRRGRKLRATLPLDDLLAPAEGHQQADAGSSEWMAGNGDPGHAASSREMGQKLQEKQRLAIVMFTIEQMPQKQVAQAMECSVEAVKWHVFQGRKKLRELMQEYL
mgnify:CR=1 FL=1